MVVERFAPGAFDAFLARRTTAPCLLDHDSKQRYGTAVLIADAKGVRFRVEGRGLPKGCRGVSPYFFPTRWRYGRERSTVLQADMGEVSLLVKSLPAYPKLTKYLREVPS